MLEVELINLDVNFPHDEVKIIALQPFVKFPSPANEPYKWLEKAISDQVKAIDRTIEVSSISFNKGADFILFPEYSIPGMAGIEVIEKRFQLCKNNCVIIGGVHGLTKSEYAEIYGTLNDHLFGPTPDSIPNYEWVNCSIIWIKDNSGIVQRYIQFKIRPSWPEMNIRCSDMTKGNKIYVFSANYDSKNFPFRFSTFICFDWLANNAGESLCDEFLDKLTNLQYGKPSYQPLDWMFVIQHNSGPNHHAFLNSTSHFFVDSAQFPYIERNNAVIIHANTAATFLPSHGGNAGGFSACVFSPAAQYDTSGCRPTVCMRTDSLRKSKILDRCKDVVFREMGECIHGFSIRVPRFITPNVSDRTVPLPKALVFSVNNSKDPRLSNGPIPASIKWINDSLDVTKKLSEEELLGCRLMDQAKQVEDSILPLIRQKDQRETENLVNFATASFSDADELRSRDRQINIDIWDHEEFFATKHVLHSITAIGLAYDIELKNTDLHCVIKDDDCVVQIVAIRGNSHSHCRMHYDKYVPKIDYDPVLVIVRDENDLVPNDLEYTNIYGTTDGVAFLDYQSLITCCRNANGPDLIKNYINDRFPRPKRIL